MFQVLMEKKQGDYYIFLCGKFILSGGWLKRILKELSKTTIYRILKNKKVE